MKIAVTGGSGGIGRAVRAEALRQGHSIVSIDRVPAADTPADDRTRFVTVEMSDFEALLDAFAGCDALIHMAAIPSPGRHPGHVVHNNNVVGSYNALAASAELGIRRIAQASSVNAIGLSFSREAHFDYFPIDELHANYSEEPYSMSKWICEQQADAKHRIEPAQRCLALPGISLLAGGVGMDCRRSCHDRYMQKGRRLADTAPFF